VLNRRRIQTEQHRTYLGAGSLSWGSLLRVCDCFGWVLRCGVGCVGLFVLIGLCVFGIYELEVGDIDVLVFCCLFGLSAVLRQNIYNLNMIPFYPHR